MEISWTVTAQWDTENIVLLRIFYSWYVQANSKASPGNRFSS